MHTPLGVQRVDDHCFVSCAEHFSHFPLCEGLVRIARGEPSIVTILTDTAAEPEWVSIRDHRVRLERPDVIFFRANGDVTGEDVDQFIPLILSWPRPERGFFYLSDISHLGYQSQQLMARFRSLPPNFIRASAVFGASFRHRVLLEIMLRTGRVLGLTLSTHLPIHVKSIDEAHAYFEKHRKGEI